MASILSEYHQHCGNTEVVTASQLDVTYAALVNCDTATDVVLIEVEGESEPIAYARSVVGKNWKTTRVTSSCLLPHDPPIRSSRSSGR